LNFFCPNSITIILLGCIFTIINLKCFLMFKKCMIYVEAQFQVNVKNTCLMSFMSTFNKKASCSYTPQQYEKTIRKSCHLLEWHTSYSTKFLDICVLFTYLRLKNISLEHNMFNAHESTITLTRVLCGKMSLTTTFVFI